MEYGKIEERSQENSTYLNSMDLAKLDEMDPSLGTFLAQIKVNYKQRMDTKLHMTEKYHLS